MAFTAAESSLTDQTQIAVEIDCLNVGHCPILQAETRVYSQLENFFLLPDEHTNVLVPNVEMIKSDRKKDYGDRHLVFTKPRRFMARSAT